jgi:hypothetical protein
LSVVDQTIGPLGEIASAIRSGLEHDELFTRAWRIAKGGHDVHVGFAMAEALGAESPAEPEAQEVLLEHLATPAGSTATLFGLEDEMVRFIRTFTFGPEIRTGPLGTAPLILLNIGAVFKAMKI